MFSEIKENVHLIIMEEEQYKEKFNNFDNLDSRQQKLFCTVAENNVARYKQLLAEWKEELASEEYSLLAESFFEETALEEDTVKVCRYLTNSTFI